MQLLRWLSNEINKGSLNIHVYIFSICPPLKIPSVNALLNLINALKDCVPIFISNDTLQKRYESTVMKNTPNISLPPPERIASTIRHTGNLGDYTSIQDFPLSSEQKYITPWT